jgi:hypothetical protein
VFYIQDEYNGSSGLVQSMADLGGDLRGGRVRQYSVCSSYIVSWLLHVGHE